MGQSDKPQNSNNGLNSFTIHGLSRLSKFFIFVSLASILVALFGLGRNILLVLNKDLSTTWDRPSSILFYFPAGVILLMADKVYRKSKMPNWQLGGAIGFAVYVSLHWVTNLGLELDMPDFFQLPLFLAFQVADMLWHPIYRFLLENFGSIRHWVDTLGMSWFAAIPFTILGTIYTGARRNQWQPFLAIALSLLFLLLCLSVLWFMWLLSFL